MDLTAAIVAIDIQVGADEHNKIDLAITLPGDAGYISVAMTPAEARRVAGSLAEMARLAARAGT